MRNHSEQMLTSLLIKDIERKDQKKTTVFPKVRSAKLNVSPSLSSFRTVAFGLGLKPGSVSTPTKKRDPHVIFCASSLICLSSTKACFLPLGYPLVRSKNILQRAIRASPLAIRLLKHAVVPRKLESPSFWKKKKTWAMVPDRGRTCL